MTILLGRRLNGRAWNITPPAAWDTLTPYSAVNKGWMNASGVTLASPFVSSLHFAQRADIPAGSYPALFSGSTQISTQVDLTAPAYADGSFAVGALSAILPDTLTANGTGGDTITYTVKAVAGTAPNTPKFSLATWSAANDLRLVFHTNFANQADTTSNFELKVSDVIAAGIVEGVGTGSGYPLSSYRTERSGPVCMGWKFRGYMRRQSDGAYHTQLVASIYVTAVTLTDMLIDCKLELPRGVDTGAVNPLQTVGPVTAAALAGMIGIAELRNNGAMVKTWGGPTDYRAITFPPTTTDVNGGATVNTVDTVANQIVFPNAGALAPHNATGYVFTTTGTLPAGMVANQPYFTSVDYFGQRVDLVTQRGFLGALGGWAYAVLWAPTTTYAAFGLYYTMYTNAAANMSLPMTRQQIYIQVTPGTSGTVAPSGTATDQVDGTAHWTPANPLITSVGTGTLSAYPVVHVFPLTEAWLVDDQTTDPVWTGAGPAPHVEVIMDLTYHLQYARALPTYDQTITPMYPDAFQFSGYSVGEPSVYQTIDSYGDNPGTNLVGYLNNTNANALLQQRSVALQRYARSEAMRWADHWTTVEDPRSFMPVIGNNGPGNVAGTYAGLGASLNTFYMAWPGKSANGFAGIGTGITGGSYYNAKYSKLVNGSHLPAMWILPYHKTARTIFLDQGFALANATMLSNSDDQGRRTYPDSITGRTYCSTVAIYDQARGQGWSTRCLDCISDVLPAAHPMRAYTTDLVQDTIDAALAVIEQNRVNDPLAYNMGSMLEGSNATIYGSKGWQIQLFFLSIRLLALAQAARKGRNPGWRTIVEHMGGRGFMPILDDAGVGNVGMAGFNLPQTYSENCVITVGAGDVVTLTPQARTNTPTGTPAPITYTVLAGATPASVAAALVALINSTPTFTAWGLVARLDTGAYFNIRVPDAAFNLNNDHLDGEVAFTATGTTSFWTRQLTFAVYGKSDTSGNMRYRFATMAEMLDYNLGTGWVKARTGNLVNAGTDHFPYGTPTAPSTTGCFPWGTVQYPIFVRMALATMAEAGIVGQGPSDAATICAKLEDLLQTTVGGPMKFTGASAGQPGNGNRTFPNFDIRRPQDQARYPNS